MPELCVDVFLLITIFQTVRKRSVGALLAVNEVLV